MTQVAADLGGPKFFTLGHRAGGENAYLVHGCCPARVRATATEGLAHWRADVELFYEGGKLDLGDVQGQVIPLGVQLVAEVSVSLTFVAGDHYRLHLDFMTEPQGRSDLVVAYQAFVQTRRPE